MPRWLNFPLMAPSLSLPQKSAPIAGNARFTESGEVNLSSPGIPIAAWSGESILAFMSASGSIWKTTLRCYGKRSVPSSCDVVLCVDNEWAERGESDDDVLMDYHVSSLYKNIDYVISLWNDVNSDVGRFSRMGCVHMAGIVVLATLLIPATAFCHYRSLRNE
jgi:hypothetical protein